MLIAVLAFLLIVVTLLLLYLLSQNVSLKSTIETRASEQFRQWREKELQGLQQQYEQIAQREADIRLSQWKQESTETIRKEAIEKSRVVTLGKVTEHVVPFFPEFQHNPKDARFLGAPVDFIVFDGLDAGEVQQITFVEVKTGSSSLTKRERQIRDAINRRCIAWEELRIASTSSQAPPGTLQTNPIEALSHNICARCKRENREKADFCGYCRNQLG